LGMLIFAASIKARVMLLVDISISSLTSKESQIHKRLTRSLGTIPYCPKLGNNLVSNAKITHYSKVSRVWSNKGGPTSEYNILSGLFTNTRSNGRTTFSHICRFSD
jgi:hypothetical protein